MFLRSLTLKGFKSFAEATTLEFEPGLTVVVGPNGSGKSNVVDAVAWVLGAQAPSTMRSARMEDVIFAGNGRRPALGRAEVSLTIDNSSGILPIGFTEVTLSRTLWRSSGESEYAINGVQCRLADIAELLSDSGVGRQQHVIVSQGNLDGILDARPEDRRLVIEEAAGILKFRRRKEKAERRLVATEGNLVRLSDLVREVRRQMRPLERQAEAARRHGDLAAEVGALRIHLAGRAIAGLQARVDAASQAWDAAAGEESSVRAELAVLDGGVAAAEARLGLASSSRLGEVSGRLEALRERGRGLGALLAERARRLSAELSSNSAEGVVEGLEATAAALVAELAEVERRWRSLGAEEDGVAAAEVALGARRAALAEVAAREHEAGKMAEVRGQLAAVRDGVTRARAEVVDLAGRLEALAADEAEAEAVVAAARARVAAADAEVAAGKAAVAPARGLVDEAEAALAGEAGAVRAARAARATWEARVEALAVAAGGDAAGAVPSDAVGVVGPLLAHLDIDHGWEAAVEAALGDAARALVVDGGGAARALWSSLPAGSALLPAPGPGAGPRSPATHDGTLQARVRATDPRIAALVDRLLAGALAATSWEEALDLALAHPERLVVSRRGDRFGPLGWRVASSGGGVAAALAEARSRAAETSFVAGAAARAEQEATTALAEARECLAARREEAEHADGGRGEARSALAQADGRLRHATAELAATRRHHGERARRVADDEGRAAALEAWLAERTPTAVALAVDASQPRLFVDLKAEREAVSRQADEAGARRTRLAARTAELGERRAQLTQRVADLEARLAAARAARATSTERAAESRLALRRTGSLAAHLAGSLARTDAHLADLHERRRRHGEWVRSVSTHLDHLRRRRAEAERKLEEARERGRRAELDQAEGRMRLDAAVEALRHEYGLEPAAAAGAPCPELPAGASAAGRVRELERELRLLGPVNPLAVEELAALQERHDFLVAQLDDVKVSRRELARVVRSVEAEMAVLLAAAYADVADNFTLLFETLFPGGQGRLHLTDPDNLLESGIDVEARPGGKSPRKLSLLSGGERSLCALAFLFAVFRSRPSPFYMLDEVEAALDDVNLHRFLRLLDEFRGEAQLLVVTHQKRTMEAADCLYGVSMAPGGSSKVLSERVRAGA